MKQLVECVPNFSDGRNPAVYNAIAAEVERGAEGSVRLLNVDPGVATNRTVITFAGEPAAVVQAAFRCIRKAAELIDMRHHHGEHPRMGATDVCPLVPISGISMQEVATLARQLGEQVGRGLGIPVYLYEYAATTPERRSLAAIRAGEYEGLEQKMALPDWRPDFGPESFNASSGATVIGARDLLVAYNINLNTDSVRKANAVAFDVREAGRPLMADGKPVLDDKGEPLRAPGLLKGVRAIGWYIKEYGFAQVSMNLTSLADTPLHIAFEAVEKSALQRGLRVTGSELIGLVPKATLLEAGKYFLRRQGLSAGVGERRLIEVAVQTLGLNSLQPFLAEKRVIEYLLEPPLPKLTDLSVARFIEEVASESPAPGGGTIAAVLGALGAALGAMVANLSANKKGWEAKQPAFSAAAEKLQLQLTALQQLAEEDTQVFNQVMASLKLPNGTVQEKAARQAALQVANLQAATVPFKVMESAIASYETLQFVAREGNPNSASDSGVAALCLHTAVYGAALNVRINLGGVADGPEKQRLADQALLLLMQSADLHQQVLAVVEDWLSKLA